MRPTSPPEGRSRQPRVAPPKLLGAGFSELHPGERVGAGGWIPLLHLPGPCSKPGNLPGPSQGFPMRVSQDSPIPEGLESHSLGHPFPLLDRTPGVWGLSGELQTSLVLEVPGFPTDYIPADPLSVNMSQLSMGVRFPSARLPGRVRGGSGGGAPPEWIQL